VVGMLLFPGSLGSIHIWIKSFFVLNKNLLLSPNLQFIEGTELLPINGFSFWQNSSILACIFVISVSIFLYYYLKDRKKDFQEDESKKYQEWRMFAYPAFLLSFLSFCFSVLISGRFQDFYFFAVSLFFALIMQRIFNDEALFIKINLRKFMLGGVVVFFSVAFLNGIFSQRNSFKFNDYDGLKNSSEWIAERSSEKEIVFLYDWDSFPISFFFNQKNYYTMGIEPKAILDYDPKLYWKWYNMFLYNYYCDRPEDCGDEKAKLVQSFGEDQQMIDEFNKGNSEKIINSIKKDFHSRFVISNSAIFDSLLKQNLDLIKDSYSYTSKSNGFTVSAFELK
jgi:hypothetical protein